MNRRLILFTPLLIALALGLILYTAIGKDPTRLESARLNDPVPEFSLQDLQDQSVHRNQEVLRGEVRLLNVWATWCPSCRSEHPYLLVLAGRGIPIVGLNYKDERGAAVQWLEQLGDPYRFNLYDPHGRFGFDLGVYGAPETYLIDSQGLVRHRHVGELNERVWKETLEPLYQKLIGEQRS
jgi:cytochrome c biogenesis protein CcmG/thiol:disulfide interchange protein DsbE